MAGIRIVTARAPGLIPSLVAEVNKPPRPVVLIPESFTLACETEIVNSRPEGGIFDLPIFSPSSLVREIRELTGRGNKRAVSGDGQNMMISRLLHHHREELTYYRESAAQPALAAKIAAQIDEFARARLTPEYLREYRPASRRTAAKLQDAALIWEGYREMLGTDLEDTVGQWAGAVRMIRRSGLLRGHKLLIYGFDYINHDILSLVQAAAFPAPDPEGQAAEVVIGLISDDTGRDRDIFRGANDSVRSLAADLKQQGIPFRMERYAEDSRTDPGISYVEKNIYAYGAFAPEKTRVTGGNPVVLREDPVRMQEAAKQELGRMDIPDMRHVHMIYAQNSYMECQHACRTLIAWHQEGVPWEDMAVAVCEQSTLPSLLPLTLSEAGIPFNAKQDRPILVSGYAQYVLSLLRILRLNYAQEDVLRMIKTGYTPLQGEDIMDMENYARGRGIHRRRWLTPFRMPEKESEREKTARLEEMRRGLTEPIESLRKKLAARKCTGRQAAAALFDFITEAGVYARLLAEEEALAGRGDDAGIDRNRQAWTAVNELLDMLASFVGDEPLALRDLCAMLEASLAARKIKSLPQLGRAVTVAPPQMFFSSGIRRMIVMGMQENELSPAGGILSEQERTQLETYIGQRNRAEEESGAERPYSRIGQSLQDVAARRKQDVYQAVSLAREELVLTCASAKPSGGIMTPSPAFSQLMEQIRKTNPENVHDSLMDSGLPPFAPAFALEMLAVKLREKKDGTNSLSDGSGEADDEWRRALGALICSEAWRRKAEGVLNALHIRVPEAKITPERAEKLYRSRGMSISRVETFASCPWQHLMQYGLDLVPDEKWAFPRNEQGTFHHDILKMFLDRAMKLPEWPDISERTETALLNEALRERAAQWEGTILTSDMLHRYQGADIIRGVRTTVGSMMRAFRRKPHFLPAATEIPFGKADETGAYRLPAIRIRTEKGDTIAFTGRIDRIDRLETADGKKYFLIVDNKMSSRDVQRNSLLAGLQLQLPLYIRAAREGLPGYEAAGGLYQPVRDVLTDSEERDEIREKIDKTLQTSGILLDDDTVRKAMQPVKESRRGGDNDTISAVTAEEMREVTDRAVEVITDRVNGILRGEAAPRPVQDGAVSPCAWCIHADACLFDPTIPGCRAEVISHKGG